MVIYDTRPLRLVGQVVLDVVLVGGIVVSVLLGVAVSRSISALAGIGSQVHDQGATLREQLGKAASAVGRIPFAGDAASSPLRSAGRTAASIAAAGMKQHDATVRLGHQVGVGLAVILSLVLVVVWIRYRGGFIRRATATRRVERRPGGTEVLALRALVHRDAAAVLGLTVVARWREGDEATVLALADLERRASGLRARRSAEVGPAV
jgi:hypothetical protein